jgi:hypothetical protein
MSFLNNTILLPNLVKVICLLNNTPTNEESNCCVYSNRVAIKHYSDKNQNIIRIWKTKSLFNYWYDDFSVSRIIGAIDYTINDDHIKIDYLSVNDDENSKKNGFNSDVLEDSEAQELINSMLNFVKIIANEKNKNKIINDTHKKLRLYEKYFKNAGFVITNRKCADNPCWIETELILNNDECNINKMRKKNELYFLF